MLTVRQECASVGEQFVAVFIGEQIGEMNVGDVLLQRRLRIRTAKQFAAVFTPRHVWFVGIGRCCEVERLRLRLSLIRIKIEFD